MTAITQSTALWYASRATGVVSLLLLTLVVVLGIAGEPAGPPAGAARVRGHRPAPERFPAVGAVHRGPRGHGDVDPYVTIRWAAVVIPFASAYQPFWLGLGAVALDLIAALILTSLARARMPRRAWRGIHWLAYAAWPVALVHGVGVQPRPAQRRAAAAGDRLRAGGRRRRPVAAAAGCPGGTPGRACRHRAGQRPAAGPARTPFLRPRS